MALAIAGNGDEEYTKVNEEVTDFARAAAAFWKQRAKIKWMIDRDTCTKYFFNWVKGRAGRNYIHGVKGSDGNWLYEEGRVRGEFQKAFMDLYLSLDDSVEWRDRSLFEPTLKYLDHSFPQDELDRLSRPFSAKEVRAAVFQMGALKAPGPDANRLAKVMGSLVSETQNDFLPGRSISDNILVAHEAINKISSHGYGRQALGAFKTDMSKAYDRVRWDFLEAVLVRIFRQKLFGTQVVLQGMTPIRGTGCSWGIRIILHGLSIVMENIGWKPGLVSRLNVWTARWVGGERPEPRIEWLNHGNGHLANLQVRNLLRPDGRWNKDFIEGMFTEEWAARILAIPRCEMRMGDRAYWPRTTSGIYTVKSGYGLIFEEHMINAGTVKDNGRLNDRGRLFCRKMLWKLPVPQMWKILIWKIITNVIPTGQEFSKRNIEVDFFCGMCKGDQRVMETSEHLFRDCGFSSRIWAGSFLGIRVEGARGTPISDWIYDWIYYLSKREEGMCHVIHFVAVLWGLWTLRNRIKFQDQVVHSHLITNMFYNVVGERAQILCNDLASKQTRSDRRIEEDG
ncbi:uncharacterized protein LOC141613604 [Silene latifolia]|uniref:uncharacterized protein LOC141613604 n=1 Tax=Silene latifolia TaxID=37657 RepID=UPI003D76C561